MVFQTQKSEDLESDMEQFPTAAERNEQMYICLY